MVKKVGKYEIGKTIGEGTFGKVKLAINTETGDKMAIKVKQKKISPPYEHSVLYTAVVAGVMVLCFVFLRC